MAYQLFVYGTLLQDGNELADHLKIHCTYLQPGKIRGLLYDTGSYPALIIGNANTFVYGSLYEIDENTLKLTDNYEGFGNEQEQPNLYKRTSMEVITAGEPVTAWVYVYNRSTKGLPLIKSGDYLKYLAQKKIPRTMKPGDR